MSGPELERDPYPRQKLSEALHLLAPSVRPLDQRLTAAIGPLIHLDERHFDDRDLWVRVSAIRERASALDAVGDEGRIAATVAKMSDEEMEKMADEIVSLACHYVLDNDRA